MCSIGPQALGDQKIDFFDTENYTTPANIMYSKMKFNMIISNFKLS